VSLQRVRDTWTQLGEREAFWAVLAGAWGSSLQSSEEEFFAHGAAEIVARLHELRELGVEPARGAALDFGCGAGRLTRALAQHFERAVGVDIAPSMIGHARRLNREYPRAEFFLNEEDLSQFADGSFDFVYSNLVLQHMPPELSRRYIAELFRVARPGGVVVFQLPSHFLEGPPPLPRTARAEPLPPGGMRAEIRYPARLLRMPPGARVHLIVRVLNVSDVAWPALGGDDGDLSIRLGNHWRSRWVKRLLRLDDGRGILPYDLAPGEEAELGLYVTAPPEPGRYLLELEMVQEHVAWFGNPLRIEVQVSRQVQEPSGFPARMEMHAIPRPEVEELIRAAGGEIIDVREDGAAGPGIVSFRYYARRTPVSS
jgi:SAM-dependent methyltransferase